jgi:hypothetical protein
VAEEITKTRTPAASPSGPPPWYSAHAFACGEGAWEHLAWLGPGDDDHPYGRAYPAEFFGPLPVVATADTAGVSAS